MFDFDTDETSDSDTDTTSDSDTDTHFWFWYGSDLIPDVSSLLQNTFAVADAEESLPVLNKTLMSLLILILAGVFVEAQNQ
mgnify:CR=1 FL=1